MDTSQEKEFEKLKKLWPKIEKKSPLPNEAIQAIEQGYRAPKAAKIGKKAIDKPTSLFGSLKHGMKQGWDESKKDGD